MTRRQVIASLLGFVLVALSMGGTGCPALDGLIRGTSRSLEPITEPPPDWACVGAGGGGLSSQARPGAFLANYSSPGDTQRAIDSKSLELAQGPDFPVPGVTQYLAAASLPGFRALFTGGIGAGTHGAAAVAYLYDRDSNTISRLPDMNTPRIDHVMTRLQDDRVLITGGSDGGANTWDSAEVFDPATQTFTATSSMNSRRTGHGAALLKDGRVLVLGGDAFDLAAPSHEVTAETFDPSANTFTLIGPILVNGSLTAILKDGRVLHTGEFDSTKAELFDPQTNVFTLTGNMISAHSVYATATSLDDGRVLIAGGWSVLRESTRATDLYDPATGQFSAGPQMHDARQGHIAIKLADGNVLIAGGQNDAGDDLDTAEIFDPDSNAFTLLDSRLDGPRAFFAGAALGP